MWFLWWLLSISVGCLIACRLLVWLVVWFVGKVLGADVTVGSVGLLRVGQVTIIDQKGNKIVIGSAWCSSSLLNSDSHKLVCVCFDGVHVYRSSRQSEKPASNKPQRINSKSLRLLQHVGVTILSLEVHTKTSRTQWDLILDHVTSDTSRDDHLELNATKLTLHCRDTDYRLLFVLSFMLNLSVVLGKPERGNLLEDVDIKINSPRGFLKEELFTLFAEERSSTPSKSTKNQPKLDWIPSSLNVEISKSNFAISRDEDCRNLSLACENLCGVMLCNTLSKAHTSLNVDMKTFRVTSVKGPMVAIQSASFSAKTDEVNVVSVLKLQEPVLEYQENEVLYWWTVVKSMEREKPSSSSKPHPLAEYLSSRTLSLSVELAQMSASVSMERSLCFRLNYLQCLMTQVENMRKLKIDTDTVYCHLGLDEIVHNRNVHDWRTVFYLGGLTVDVDKKEKVVSINTNLDSVQMDFSTNAVEIVTGILQNMHLAMLAYYEETESVSLKSRKSRSAMEAEVTISGKISNINLFATNNYHYFIMTRVDSISADQEQRTLVIHVTGNKLVYAKRTRKPYYIVPAADIRDYVGLIPEIKNVFELDEKELYVSIVDDIHFRWTTGFQMVVYQLQKDIESLRDGIRNLFGKKESNPRKERVRFKTEFTISASATLDARLSREHSVTFGFDQSQMIMDKNGEVEIMIHIVAIDFDQEEIFIIEDLSISSCEEAEAFEAERQSFHTLETRTNRAWLITLDRLDINFPYQYNFALCWERVMRTRKFLKKLHSSGKKSSSLAADLGFKIKLIHIQIDDDPFEVKLGDNYALLVDEHREGEKRISAMDRRICELRKKHGLLPTGKVDELYASLHQKNSTIYLKRSLQQYTEHPMRTALFQWKMEEFELFMLADPTVHGKENCVRHMREIDSESPFPDNLEFNTLFGRMVNGSIGTWTVQLRDYTQSMFEVQDLHWWGRLIVGEPMGTPRARYTVTVEVPDPWEDVIIDKNMPNPKFYHDISCDVKSMILAYGACWEPCMAQYNQAMDKINKPSVDPSKPMPFWDKIRLLYHGRLTMSVTQMSWLYHTSLDPFNSTEFMDWTYTNLVFDWTNGKFVLKGDLDVYLRTASKYDDCRFLHLPNLTFGIGLEWLCHGDKNDHHSVMPCHPDKVPEFSLEEHDSYRAFRSQKVNMNLSMETKACQDEEGFDDIPCCLFYSSTARFLERIKMCIARVSRPIKRGTYYHTKKPKKKPLSRHYNNIGIKLNFSNPFQVCYWASFAKQHGLEMLGNSFTLDGVFRLDLIPQEGPLARRAIASWSVVRLRMDLDKAQTWVCSTSQDDRADEANTSMRSPIIRSFLFSVQKLKYFRDEKREPYVEDEKPVHQVDIIDLKGAWTTRNRNIMIGLYDNYSKAAALRRSLSSDALKGYKMEENKTPMKKHLLNTSSASIASPSPHTRLQSGHAYSLLQKLVSETDSKFVAFAEEPSVGNNMEQLHGVTSCQTGDVIKKNWAIDLHHSQVIMRGIETAGYVIVSASRAHILSCEHRAVWHDQQLKTKTTWVGSLECMQYYSTVASQPDADMYWLTEENVVLSSDDTVSRIPEMAGCGQSVGGVVTRTVDTEGREYNDVVQLQRIVSRCRCQFFYASYGEADPATLSEVPPLLEPSSDLERTFDEGVDSLTLLHHDLNICTNSNQYHIMMDIVNNLLLYVEPKKKIYTDKLQAMRFKLELSSIDDQRTPILALQEKLRQNILTMRSVERELYMVHRYLDEDPFNDSLMAEADTLEARLYKMKEQISNDGEDLGIMISGFIARQLEMETRQKHSTKRAAPALVSRRNEVCFKHAQWRLTEMDGQIGITDLVLRDFLYVKTNNNDDSGSHLVELGWAKMQNLLPNSIYKDVLMPQDTGGKLDDVALRIVCRVKPPVGGISVKEHLEVNLVPVQIQITSHFYRAMMEFFFPGEEQDDADDTASVASVESNATAASKDDKSSFRSYVDLPDDIDKMKERAARNNTFLHVKIPELPLRISYKGEREKNVTDVHDMLIRLPPLEIHNQTWTWLDLLMAVKNSSKRALLSQAIKQKLHMPRRQADDTVTDVQLEEDKAKMLLGAKLVTGNEKINSKKSLFGKSKLK